MKSYLQTYFAHLARQGKTLHFEALTCRYGKFTMYCLVGPEENIYQVTFALQKHEQLQKLFSSVPGKVTITRTPQKKFQFNDLFAEYFSGMRTNFQVMPDSPLLAAGTDFQKRVWQHISEIPYGNTITYRRLAELAGSPMGSRAAGTACGANPVALLIPCHRVVAQNGLGGFAGGLAIKKALLGLEKFTSSNE